METIAALTRRMLARHGLEQVKVSVHFALDDAIRGAAFVLTQFRVGQLPARAADERLGLKYQLLGQETTGVGGFAKALRTIPVMLDIARRVEKLAPDAWIINFTNPAGIVTEAVSRFTKAKIIGLCNVPISMHHMIANMLQAPYADVQLQFAGLNHMVWVHRVTHLGRDVTAKVIDMLCDGAALTMNNIKEEPWQPDFLRALGAILPVPPLFLPDPRDAGGRDGRRRRARHPRRAGDAGRKELFELYADPQLNTKPEQLSFRGGSFYSEVALELIRAIHNNLGTQLVVNTANRGAIHGLPDDAVIEINCIVDAQGAHPLTFGPLPEPMQALTQQVKAYERLTIEAAVHGDRRSGLLALIANPLVGNANLAQPLLDEVLTINAPYLPQFR